MPLRPTTSPTGGISIDPVPNDGDADAPLRASFFLYDGGGLVRSESEDRNAALEPEKPESVVWNRSIARFRASEAAAWGSEKREGRSAGTRRLPRLRLSFYIIVGRGPSLSGIGRVGILSPDLRCLPLPGIFPGLKTKKSGCPVSRAPGCIRMGGISASAPSAGRGSP